MQRISQCMMMVRDLNPDHTVVEVHGSLYHPLTTTHEILMLVFKYQKFSLGFFVTSVIYFCSTKEIKK